MRDRAQDGRVLSGQPAQDASIVWHEAECSGYAADLPLWAELAKSAKGTILDLGCGTGRVASHLARRGHDVVGLDMNPGLAATMEVPAVVADARSFQLDAAFSLVLAPMQLVQLFADSEERVRCLRSVERHLTTDGVAALAIVESMPSPVDASPPLPDTREVDGWVYSSLPIETLVEDGAIRVRRLRQTVSPGGELSEQLDEIVLQTLDAATLEREAQRVGLRPAGRKAISATDAHVGSTVVLLGREA